jgi:uracil-DNA glycosylase
LGKPPVAKKRTKAGRLSVGQEDILTGWWRRTTYRSKLYITSVVKETTPRNRRPTAQEIRYWIPYLLEEIGQVKPKIVILMGEIARKTPRLKAVEYIETYHPAAAMRFPRAREKFESDFEKLGKLVGQLQRPKKRSHTTTHTGYSA